MTSLPFAPPARQQPPLRLNAPASEHFGRLLDALLVLQAEGSCRIADLASRVGLAPERLRSLLSTFMTAGANLLDADVPLTVSFGTADGPLSADEDDDEAQSSADVVWLETGGRTLFADLGRRPVMVKDVARALLAASLVLEDPQLSPDRKAGIASLRDRLSEGLGASVEPPAGSVAHTLQAAIGVRRKVRLRYLHPWTGVSTSCVVEPYDLRRQRDRLVLDAGQDSQLTSYDVAGISEVDVLEEGFEPPLLPARDERTPRVPVVLRIPTGPRIEDWLLRGWDARVLGPVGNDQLDVRLELDGDATDPGVASRLGVLLLQLGPGCTVVSPEELRRAAVPVGQRLIELHGR